VGTGRVRRDDAERLLALSRVTARQGEGGVVLDPDDAFELDWRRL